MPVPPALLSFGEVEATGWFPSTDVSMELSLGETMLEVLLPVEAGTTTFATFLLIREVVARVVRMTGTVAFCAGLGTLRGLTLVCWPLCLASTTCVALAMADLRAGDTPEGLTTPSGF